MTHSYCILLLLFVCLASPSAAQIDSLKQIRVSGGMSDPRAPGSFYDYWKNGFDLEVGADYNLDADFDFTAAAEFSYYPFARERFFQKIKVNDFDVSMTGAGASILALTGNATCILYQSKDNPKVSRPYILGGAGILLSSISSSTINYPLAPTSEGRSIYVAPCIHIGCGLITFLSPGMDWFIEVNYLYGVTTSQKINTDYSSLRAGIAVAP